MYFNRWDICSAYYCYFSLYLSGDRGVSEDSLSDNAREIYKQLLERNGIKE